MIRHRIGWWMICLGIGCIAAGVLLALLFVDGRDALENIGTASPAEEEQPESSPEPLSAIPVPL